MLHHRLLKWFPKQGMRVIKLPTVLSFSQPAWLMDYTDSVNEKRKEANTDFERKPYPMT